VLLTLAASRIERLELAARSAGLQGGGGSGVGLEESGRRQLRAASWQLLHCCRREKGAAGNFKATIISQGDNHLSMLELLLPSAPSSSAYAL